VPATCNHRDLGRHKKTIGEYSANTPPQREIPAASFGCRSLGVFPGTVALLPQADAGNLATDPNAAQIVQHFIYKPKPTELLLKPQAEKPKPNKPAKDAED
jgi:hypothetical protein